MNVETYWTQAVPFHEYVADVEKNRALWEGIFRTAKIPEWAVKLACEHASQVRLLVIAEDWCGDASNTVPVLARLSEAADCLEVRVVKRDEHPELMDQFLTNGSRSIPIVIAVDRGGDVVGHWGPRPSELQAWVMANKDSMPKDKLYPEVRRWYARDRGAMTIREVMAMFDPNGGA